MIATYAAVTRAARSAAEGIFTIENNRVGWEPFLTSHPRFRHVDLAK